MTVHELIDMLGECNPKATVHLEDVYGQVHPSEADREVTGMVHNNVGVILTTESTD